MSKETVHSHYPIKRFSKLKGMLFFMLLFCAFTLKAQTTVFGYLKDEVGKPVERAKVDLIQSPGDLIADKIGYFQFVNLTPGTYQVIITKAGLESKTIEFTVEEQEKRKDLGVISLWSANQSTDLGIIVLDDAIADSDGSQVQPMTRLLSARRDVYQKNATLELGLYSFVPRGVDNRFEEISFNGVSMADPIDGIVDPVQWGGLSDLTRNPSEVSDYLAFSKYTYANLAGSLYYDTRASNFNKETSLTYSYLNRNYKNRLMLSHASGLRPSGWAYAFSLSKRWGEDGIIEGIGQDSYAYFASVEKKLSPRASLNLTAFGAPTQRETYSANTKEVYTLGGKNYNSYWGYDQGKERNARVRNAYLPIFQVQYYQKIGDQSQLNSTLSYQFGRDAQSRLSWRDAPNPYPTHYTYLPSYILSEGGSESEYEESINRWHTSKENRQINWELLKRVNRLVPSYGAKYLMVEDVKEIKTLNFASHFETKITDFWDLNLNLSYQRYEGEHYQEIKDLLGADFALNQYQLPGNQLYNVNDYNPNVVEGDKYKYHYTLSRDQFRFNASSRATLANWDLLASVFAGYSNSMRVGKYKNPYYLQNSEGRSPKIESFDAGVKARVGYNFSSRSQLSYSALFYSAAPSIADNFINPRLNNLLTPEIKNQVVSSNELKYSYMSPDLSLSASGFWSEIKNATTVNRFYSDLYSSSSLLRNSESYVTEILSGVDKRYVGAELGAEVRVLPNVKVFGTATIGHYTHLNNPTVLLATENENSALGYQNLGKAEIKDYKLAGSPQTAVTLGYRYSNRKLWWFGGSANFLADHYMDFFAANRTPSFYTNPTTGSNYEGATDEKTGLLVPPAEKSTIDPLLEQVRLKDQWLFNLDAGKTFSVGRYTLSLSLSVINVLNNRSYITGGYEQIRNANYPDYQLDAQRSEPLFDTKFWYDRGRTFFANVNLKF